MQMLYMHACIPEFDFKMDSDMLNANLYGRKIKKRRMFNFWKANEDDFVRSLVTDQPITRPTVSQGLTGSRQSVLSRKKNVRAMWAALFTRTE